jgi:hypothetical protein
VASCASTSSKKCGRRTEDTALDTALDRCWKNLAGNLPHRVMRRLPFVDEQKKTRLRSHLSA